MVTGFRCKVQKIVTEFGEFICRMLLCRFVRSSGAHGLILLGVPSCYKLFIVRDIICQMSFDREIIGIWCYVEMHEILEVVGLLFNM